HSSNRERSKGRRIAQPCEGKLVVFGVEAQRRLQGQRDFWLPPDQGPVASHSQSLPSPAALTSSRPSGLKATAGAPCTWPRRRSVGRPVTTSHTIAAGSFRATARRLPSGLNATACTFPVCPSRVCRQRPVATSQSFTSLLSEALTRSRPSGLKATPVTT